MEEEILVKLVEVEIILILKKEKEVLNQCTLVSSEEAIMPVVLIMMLEKLSNNTNHINMKKRLKYKIIHSITSLNS